MTAKPQRRALGGWAIEQLYELIFTGQLPAGADLGEEMLCKRLDVSRATIGVALRQLEQEGLAEITAGNGRRQVAEFSIQDVADLYDTRIALEGFAIERAATRITDDEIAQMEKVQYEMEARDWQDEPSVRDFGVDFEFHHIIAKASGSRRALATLQTIWNQSHALLRHLCGVGAYGNLEEEKATHADHHAILRALRDRDPIAAKVAMIDHLANRRDVLLQGIKQRGKIS